MSNAYCVVFLFCLSVVVVWFTLCANFSGLSILIALRYYLTFIFNNHHQMSVMRPLPAAEWILSFRSTWVHFRVLVGVHLTRSLVLCVCFVNRCLSSCTFSFGQCVVHSSSIYGFWMPLWYLQVLLNSIDKCYNCSSLSS